MATTSEPRKRTLWVQCFERGNVPDRLRPDDWHPWINSTDQSQTATMAAIRFARNWGIARGDRLSTRP